jgi:hypothetical protein
VGKGRLFPHPGPGAGKEVLAMEERRNGFHLKTSLTRQEYINISIRGGWMREDSRI